MTERRVSFGLFRSMIRWYGRQVKRKVSFKGFPRREHDLATLWNRYFLSRPATDLSGRVRGIRSVQVFQKGSLPVSDSHLVRFSAPVNAYLSFDSRSKVFQTSFLFCSSLRESQWVLFYSLKNSRERKILDSKNYRYMYICIYLNLRCRS